MSKDAMIYAELEFTAGEDNCDAGYFYGLDTGREVNPILDALHIFNAADIADKYLPSMAQITWSSDGNKALLLINDDPLAAFDFMARRGYCRTNFPAPDTNWTEHDHKWHDDVLALF